VILWLLLCLTVALWGQQEAPTTEDFQACFKRNQEAYVKLGGVNAVAITSNRAVSFERPERYIKYDSFLNLYVQQSAASLTPVPQNEERALPKGEWLASVSYEPEIAIGKLQGLGDSLTAFDRFTVPSRRGAIVTGVCCDMYGIAAGGERFIGNRYLEHVAAYDEVYYGEVGARFASRPHGVVVAQVNPFMANGLRAGYEIVRANKEEIRDVRTWNEMVLFSSPNSRLEVEIKRGEATLSRTLHVKPKRVISPVRETYLESLGFYVDTNLVLRTPPTGSRAAVQGLEAGDKILEIARQSVASPGEIRSLLPALERGETHHILIDRQGFHFFVTLVIPTP
jgi:membrane-associated protease RseP (regulator of RpoE activity)